MARFIGPDENLSGCKKKKENACVISKEKRTSPSPEVGDSDTDLQRGASEAVGAVNLGSGSQETPHLRRVALRRGRCQLVLQRHRPESAAPGCCDRYSGGDVWIEEQARLQKKKKKNSSGQRN